MNHLARRNDPEFLPGLLPYHEWHQNEYSWFFKDDFKVTPSLTLNLGVRWELYRVPTEAQGKMLAPVGDARFGLRYFGNELRRIVQSRRDAAARRP